MIEVCCVCTCVKCLWIIERKIESQSIPKLCAHICGERSGSRKPHWLIDFAPSMHNRKLTSVNSFNLKYHERACTNARTHTHIPSPLCLIEYSNLDWSQWTHIYRICKINLGHCTIFEVIKCWNVLLNIRFDCLCLCVYRWFLALYVGCTLVDTGTVSAWCHDLNCN